jgi:hypothetical protein
MPRRCLLPTYTAYLRQQTCSPMPFFSPAASVPTDPLSSCSLKACKTVVSKTTPWDKTVQAAGCGPQADSHLNPEGRACWLPGMDR